MDHGDKKHTKVIIASYATGYVNGYIGDNDIVGGLVGTNDTGSITASYAAGGDSLGFDGNNDIVGGLVGWNGGSIVASYSTKSVDGGSGNNDRIGALTGYTTTSAKVIASYGLGTMYHDGRIFRYPYGTLFNRIYNANQLTLRNTGWKWDDASQNTKNAWVFTAGQAPILKYADYDGIGKGVDYCSQFPNIIPGTNKFLTCNTSPLPGQTRSQSATGVSGSMEITKLITRRTRNALDPSNDNQPSSSRYNDRDYDVDNYCDIFPRDCKIIPD